MLQITSLDPQKATKNKDKKRFNVYLNEKYTFSIGQENLLKFKLAVGKILSENEIIQITKGEFFNYLVDRAINFLSFRPRSEKEIKDYLIKKISTKQKIKFSEAKETKVIEEVINKLKKYNYIDDLEFATWWIESRNANKQKGFKLIKQELTQKGLSREVLEKFEKGQDEVKLALIALSKRESRWKKLDGFSLKKKIYAFLANRGFDYETISEAFAIYLKKR
ncbi:MAG: RecX family transcriptional regulator [Patescibacteria group bacterium]